MIKSLAFDIMKKSLVIDILTKLLLLLLAKSLLFNESFLSTKSLVLR